MGEVIRRPGLEYAPDLWPETPEIYQGNGSGPGKLQRTGSPERQRRSIQDRASEPRKPRERGSTEKAG